MKQMFNRHQRLEISIANKVDLTGELTKLIKNPKLNSRQMGVIVDAFVDDNLSIEQIKIFAKPEYDYCQMIEIVSGLINGYNDEQMALYTNPKLNHMQMNEILMGLVNGLTVEQIKKFAKVEYGCNKMLEIREKIEEKIGVI